MSAFYYESLQHQISLFHTVLPFQELRAQGFFTLKLFTSLQTFILSFLRIVCFVWARVQAHLNSDNSSGPPDNMGLGSLAAGVCLQCDYK